MNGQASVGTFADMFPTWSTLLAQEVDEDLDFDEGFEKDELSYRKPPSRHPILWLLILIAGIGVAYWMWQSGSPPHPEPKIVQSEVSPTKTTDGSPVAEKAKVPSPLITPTTLNPKYGEGEQVTIVAPLTENGKSITLFSNSSRAKSSNIVQSGQLVTILDGEITSRGWIYQIQTKTGTSGWIFENNLQK